MKFAPQKSAYKIWGGRDARPLELKLWDGRDARHSTHAEKELPQPQDFVEFGLTKTNPCCMSVS